MIQLEILSGKKAGTQMVARRFPVRIGRATNSDLRLEEEGIWDNHAELLFTPPAGFGIVSKSSGLAELNGQRITESPLRNGDVIQLGSVQLRFGFAPTRPRNFTFREAATWVGLVALTLVEIGLIYFFL